MITTSAIILAIASSLLSGLGTAILVIWNDRKKELVRQKEKEKDALLLEYKECEIKFYKIQKDLEEWKFKYYNTLQELIEVKAELEKTLIEIAKITPK
jgi:hypothetical protein